MAEKETAGSCMTWRVKFSNARQGYKFVRVLKRKRSFHCHPKLEAGLRLHTVAPTSNTAATPLCIVNSARHGACSE
jgi:hypothetical protein